MLQSSQNAFRELTPEELELVAGGYYSMSGEEWVVTGRREIGYDVPQDDWRYSFNDFTDDYQHYYSGSSDEGGAGEASPAGNGLNPSQVDDALTAIDGARALLTQAIQSYGPGTMAELNGKLVPAVELLDGLGKLTTALQAGSLLAGLASGDKGLSDAIGFIAGLAAVAAAPEVAGALGAYVLGVAAEKIVKMGIEEVKVVANGVSEILRHELEEHVASNPKEQYNPGDPVDWWDALFGLPHLRGISNNYR